MNTPAWAADFHFDTATARRWLQAQFPELGHAGFEAFAQGWDNQAFLVDGRWVFRFPRRRIALNLLRIEADVLGRIAPALPLPITAPRFVGAPTADYPAPFAGYPLIEGETACRADVSAAERAEMAHPLGGFLRALHGQRVEAPADLLRRTDVARQFVANQARLATLDHPLAPALSALLEGAYEALPADAHAAGARQDTLVHGDLYARHLIVRARRLVGIIDWGDVHRGDPALDYALIHAFVPREAHDRFRAAYGSLDEPAWIRGRFRATCSLAALLAYGADQEDAALLREVAGSLARMRASAC